MPLIEARAAAFDPLNCLDLGITARRTLYGILTFFNLSKPQAAIWPRRDRLRAEALLTSESSLYRGLAQLVQRGYIARKQERIARNGRFHISPIQLTEKALILLGLTRRETASRKVIHSEPSLTAEDGQYKEHTNQRQSLQKAIRGNGSTLSSCPNRGVSNRVPAALGWLLERGLSAAGVFKLMAAAKSAGQRLEHVAIVCRSYLTTLSGREAFAYLRKAIGSNRDFATAARECLDEQAARHADETARRFLDYARSKCHGFAVKDSDGRIIGRLDTACGAVLGPRGSVPMNLRWAHACVEGRFQLQPMG
nr:hypothetical protein [Cupriavidus gilardii]